MRTVVSFEDVSKHYRGPRTYRALRDDLVGLVRPGSRRRDQPIKALDHVSFELEEGGSMALLGLNGAGKTTALKLMSRITYPTGGEIRVRGRVGALIEVGTGMHPELTGRENVHLYGQILGLTKRDVVSRFQQIVDFSGIPEAIDQPVKQYSSGMQLRLAFSIAAHLEPDVLLVDEAIAVGDAGFQYKCVERMQELVREGRTLIFVSHDMSAIETLCDRAILLRRGEVAEVGAAAHVVRQYLEAVQEELLRDEDDGPVGETLQITHVTLHDDAGAEINDVPAGGTMTVRMHYRCDRPIPEPLFAVGLSDGRGRPFTTASMLADGAQQDVLEGSGHVDCTFYNMPIKPQVYEIWGGVRGGSGFGLLVEWQRLRRFRAIGDIAGEGKGAVTHAMASSPVIFDHGWDVQQQPAEGVRG